MNENRDPTWSSHWLIGGKFDATMSSPDVMDTDPCYI